MTSDSCSFAKLSLSDFQVKCLHYVQFSNIFQGTRCLTNLCNQPFRLVQMDCDSSKYAVQDHTSNQNYFS